MDKQIIRSLKKMVEYLYFDEEKHFEEDEKPKDHIFRDVKRIDKWLKDTGKMKKFARKCSECGNLFNEGYVIGYGEDYIKIFQKKIF